MRTLSEYELAEIRNIIQEAKNSVSYYEKEWGRAMEVGSQDLLNIASYRQYQCKARAYDKIIKVLGLEE